MALQDTDLLVAYRPSTQIHYKLKASQLSSIPDGTEEGQILEWDGTDWTPSSVIDGGTY